MTEHSPTEVSSRQEYTEDKQVVLRRMGAGRRFLEALLILLGLFAGWLMAALLSFDPADPSWSQTAWHEPIHNLGGLPGAWLADTLLFVFGVMAYPLPVLLLGGCVFAWRYRNEDGHYIDYFAVALRLIGALALIITSCGLAAMNADDIWYFASGGVIGSLLGTALAPWLTVSESTIALLFVWAAGLTLFTGWSWVTIAEKVGSVLFYLLTFTSNRMRNHSKQAPHYRDDPLLGEMAHTPALAESGHKKAEKFSPPASIQSDNTLFSGERMPLISVSPDNAPDNAPNDDDVLFSAPGITEAVPEAPGTIATPENAFVQKEIAEHPPHNTVDDAPPAVDLDSLPAHQTATPLLSATPPAAPPGEPASQVIAPVAADSAILAPAPLPVSQDDAALSQLPPATPAPPVACDAFAPAEGAQADNADDVPAHSAPQAPAPLARAPVAPPAPPPAESLIHPLLMRNGDDYLLPEPITPLPELDLLTPPPRSIEPVDNFALEQMARMVETRLADFRIQASVVNYIPGPVITRFELDLAPGVKAARISNLSRDLARSLSASAVRVVEVIPGKPYVGLELPNKKRQTVYLREVMDSPQFRDSTSPLSVVLGKDIEGNPVVADLAKMPHLLVAGTTGSGKSVGVNAMILSMLYKATPEEVRFIMIDPKMLELSVYEGIPHLLTEVVTDMKDAANALHWSVSEMERRYKLMSALGVRNLAGYNDKIRQAEAMERPIPDPYWKPGDGMGTTHPMLEHLPYIVVLVDEFADLMMTVGKKVEEFIARLAQKARAAGIHLVLATQRPSVDVITGLIKANIPTRIAFTVSSKIDSRTILDQGGAESLLGMGDMLYSAPSSNIPIRVHGAFVRDQEVHAVVQDWKARARPQYIDGITAEAESETGGGGGTDDSEALDPLFDQAVAFVVEKRKASISGVQRQFRIGYNRAARIIEQMEIQGIVSEQGHNGNRDVLAPPQFE